MTMPHVDVLMAMVEAPYINQLNRKEWQKRLTHTVDFSKVWAHEVHEHLLFDPT